MRCTVGENYHGEVTTVVEESYHKKQEELTNRGRKLLSQRSHYSHGRKLPLRSKRKKTTLIVGERYHKVKAKEEKSLLSWEKPTVKRQEKEGEGREATTVVEESYCKEARRRR